MTISPVGLNPVDQAQLAELQAAQAAARAVAPDTAAGANGADEVLNDAATQAQSIQNARNDRGIATAQINDQILADQDLQAIQLAQTLQEAQQQQSIQDARLQDAQVQDSQDLQAVTDANDASIQQQQQIDEQTQAQAIATAQAQDQTLEQQDLQNRLQADAIERAQVAAQILQNGQAPDAAEQIRVGQNQQAQLAEDTPLTPQQELQVESITVIQATTINERAVESGTGEAVDLTI